MSLYAQIGFKGKYGKKINVLLDGIKRMFINQMMKSFETFESLLVKKFGNFKKCR